MFEKIFIKLTEFGKSVAYDYVDIKKDWVKLILWPAYIVFVILYVLTILLLTLIYTTQHVINGTVTFGEAWEAFKEGCSEGSEELEEHFKGMES